MLNNNNIPSTITRNFPPPESLHSSNELSARNLLYHQRNPNFSLSPPYVPYPLNSSYSKQIHHEVGAGNLANADNGLANLERAFGNHSCILNEQSNTKSNSSSDIDCEEVAEDL